MTPPGLTREELARRAAQELKNGDYVNLGQGIPTLVGSYVDPGIEIMLHGENGILGIGPHAEGSHRDIDLINAGKEPVTLLPGASFFPSDLSFTMLRGGHLDVCILGAYQVSEKGDIANWQAPGRTFGGMGGAMDIAAGTKHLIVIMTHAAKDGSPKIVRECSYPLTAKGAVDRIITDLAVIDIEEDGLWLRELLPGVSVEELQALTEPPLRVADDLKPLEVRASKAVG